jgi:putative FmdB family regulatory protein
MPTYEYVCLSGHTFERFEKMSDAPRTKCPVCGKRAVRQISGGAGLVFKGSGFYITDYGKDGKGPRTADKSGEKQEKGTEKTAATEKSKPAASDKGGDSGGAAPKAPA